MGSRVSLDLRKSWISLTRKNVCYLFEQVYVDDKVGVSSITGFVHSFGPLTVLRMSSFVHIPFASERAIG